MENPTAGISNKKLKYLKQDVRYNKQKTKKQKKHWEDAKMHAASLKV